MSQGCHSVVSIFYSENETYLKRWICFIYTISGVCNGSRIPQYLMNFTAQGGYAITAMRLRKVAGYRFVLKDK